MIVLIYSALGVRFGSNVFVLGTNFMEHDLIDIKDNATLTGATLQTHLYEDRFYKTGRVSIGQGALVAPGGFALYGSSIGAEASLAPHSLLMRGEHFGTIHFHSLYLNCFYMNVIHDIIHVNYFCDFTD